jgi:hypothetical protein
MVAVGLLPELPKAAYVGQSRKQRGHVFFLANVAPFQQRTPGHVDYRTKKVRFQLRLGLAGVAFVSLKEFVKEVRRLVPGAARPRVLSRPLAMSAPKWEAPASMMRPCL